jgi:elongation factor P hydroxylase
MTHDYNDLIRLFNGLFEARENTVLVAGETEPLYLPADESYPRDRVIFANGFFASALHEISHWCIAGPARRRQVDFGYWYQPDGRTAQQQRQFETVEVKPQALEWIFSVAAGSRFNVSLDNLSGARSGREEAFRGNVQRQARSYIREGLPKRAHLFQQALVFHYRAGKAIDVDEFHFDGVDTDEHAARQAVISQATITL